MHENGTYNTLQDRAARVSVAVVTGVRLFACAALVVLSGCSGSDSSTGAQSESFPLPDSGWKPGDGGHLALARGAFHAVMTPSGACATIGDRTAPISYRWPTGYRVRFNPTQLLDADGFVIASDGEEVEAGGGLTAVVAGGKQPSQRPEVETWCGRPGENVFAIQSEVSKVS